MSYGGHWKALERISEMITCSAYGSTYNIDVRDICTYIVAYVQIEDFLRSFTERRKAHFVISGILAV